MVHVTFSGPLSRAPLTPQCPPGQTREGHTWRRRAALPACGQWCAAAWQGRELSVLVNNRGVLSMTVFSKTQ